MSTTVTALSLVLCMATVALLVRSYVVKDVLGWCYPTGGSSVRIEWGRCWWIWDTVYKWPGRDGGTDPDCPTSRYHIRLPAARPAPWSRTWSGFYCDGFFTWTDVVEPRRRRGRRDLAVPFWPVALATALPPARWLLRWRHRRRAARRARAGLCAACGYDLSGNASGRCPECGEAVPDPPGIAPGTAGAAG